MRSRGRGGDQLELHAAVDLEGPEVAGVDPDDVGAQCDRALELPRVVRLDEEVEAELAAAGEHEARLLVAKVAEQEESRVRARDTSLEQISLVVEEALREEGDVRGGARGGEVVEATAEAVVDQDRDCGRSGLREGLREGAGVCVGSQLAGRGRAPLDLRDRAQPLLRKSLPEASHQRRVPSGMATCLAPGRGSRGHGLLLGEGDERLQALRGRAGVDRFRRQGVALGQVGGVAGRRDRAGGV